MAGGVSNPSPIELEVASEEVKVSSNINNGSTTCTEEPFDYDRILDHLGHLGKAQLRAFLWLCIPAMIPGFAVMSYIFTGAIPDYRCYVPGCDDYQQTNNSCNVDFAPDWILTNLTVPMDHKCSKYNRTWEEPFQCLTQIENDTESITNTEPCDRWVYDPSMFTSTIVTEFDLTCDDEWKQPIPSVAYMLGTLFGCIILGSIADKYGRKPTFTINIFLVALVSTLSVFSPNLITFSIFRLLSGATTEGHFDVLFVWGIEGVGSKYRVACGFVYQLMYNFGSDLLGLIAYFVRDWKTLQMIISAPIFILIPLYWIVPESTRWLISEKRFSEARKQIIAAGKINKKTVPGHLIEIDLPTEGCNVISTACLTEIHPSTKNINDPIEINGKNRGSIIKGETVRDVFHSKIILKRILILSLIWISIDMCYYGITYSTSNLSGDFYLNYELTMLVDIPAYILGSFLVNWIGRKPTESVGLIICGLACLATGLVPEDPAALRVTLSLVGKFFVAGVYAAAYSYTAELFPTSVRAIAVSFCSSVGRIGGVLAPILADAGRRVNPALPYVTFAVVNIMAGALCLLLPETNNMPLPTTIQDAKDLERNNTRMNACFPSFCRGDKRRKNHQEEVDNQICGSHQESNIPS